MPDASHPIAIDVERFHRIFDDWARPGRTDQGGLNRMAATAAEGEARDRFRAWLREQGFEVRVDAIGNIFGILELAGPGAPLVMAGSHLDSQPMGGRFDGIYGVAAACEAALAVREASPSNAAEFTHNPCVVSWTNEEGARFQPSLMGSGVYTGNIDLEFALARRDAEGVSVAEALEAIGYRGKDAPPEPPAALIELHIEQNTALERAGLKIGIVEGVWGTAKYTIDFEGEAAHTGPTAMSDRRDALYGAALAIAACRDLAAPHGDRLRTAVGHIKVEPNSTNVVPAHARILAELRGADAKLLDENCARFETAVAEAARTARVDFKIEATARREAREFDPDLRRTLQSASEACGYPVLHLDSVAGHDAVMMISVCPSALVFVPCVDGLTHCEAERMRSEDMPPGVRVLARTLDALARRPISN